MPAREADAGRCGAVAGGSAGETRHTCTSKGSLSLDQVGVEPTAIGAEHGVQGFTGARESEGCVSPVGFRVVPEPDRWIQLGSGAALLLALPALGMRLHSGNLETLPDDIAEVQTFKRMTQEFPGEGTTAAVVVKAPAADQDEVAEALARLESDANASDHFVATGLAQVQVSDDGTTSLLRLAMPYDERFSQQNAFLHAGAIASVADSANGYAAYTLAPPDTDVLAVEFKINLLEPARETGFLLAATPVTPRSATPRARSTHDRVASGLPAGRRASTPR